MQVLDWRPRAEILLTSLWPRRSGGGGPTAGPFGRSWNGFHDRLVARRVAARWAAPAAPPVVSVGNLALGGTGKTPVVIDLVRGLAGQGFSGCVLTRGYRSPLGGPLVVTADNGQAGDEARLLAACLPPAGWQVLQARHRAAGLQHLLAGPTRPDVILLEDGHQTAGVRRDLDILILDHWDIRPGPEGPVVAPRTGAVFPFGPWRESAAGAARAGVWLLETASEAPRLGPGGEVVITFTRTYHCRAANAAAETAGSPQAAALVSGIARPEKFETEAGGLLASPARLAVRLADHQPYGPGLSDRLQRHMHGARCDALVTTAKDWIKLAPFWPGGIPAHVVEMGISWGDDQALPALVGERLQSAR
jgi:tetraacyldisaccharide 4'-kinase